MNKINNIISFVNGELSDPEEKALLQSISDNPELRASLKEALWINGSMATQATAKPTPRSLTNSVFNDLGFKSPKFPANNAPSSFFRNIINSNAFKNVTNTILSSLATVFIMLWLLDSDSNTEQISSNINNLKSQTGNTLEPVISEKDNPLLTQISSEEFAVIPVENIKQQNIKNNISNVSEAAKPITLSDKTTYTLISQASHNAGNISMQNKISGICNSNDELLCLNQKEIINTTDIPDYSETSIFGQHLFDIEYRQTENWHYPAETISPSEFSMFYKVGLGVYYNPNDWLSVGLDARQETFYMEYKAIAEDGYRHRYYIQPNFLTLSVAARAKMISFHGTDLLARFSLGANNVGMVDRLGIEIDFNPIEHIDLFLGLEYSHMYYEQMQKSFNSQKISLNYGIRFN